jgi:hypothetical protein
MLLPELGYLACTPVLSASLTFLLPMGLNRGIEGIPVSET